MDTIRMQIDGFEKVTTKTDPRFNPATDPRRDHHVDIDYNQCMSCGTCYRSCCYMVYTWNKQENRPEPTHDLECVGCRQCEAYCPANAINVHQPEIVFFDPLFDPLGLNDPQD